MATGLNNIESLDLVTGKHIDGTVANSFDRNYYVNPIGIFGYTPMSLAYVEERLLGDLSHIEYIGNTAFYEARLNNMSENIFSYGTIKYLGGDAFKDARGVPSTINLINASYIGGDALHYNVTSIVGLNNVEFLGNMALYRGMLSNQEFHLYKCKYIGFSAFGQVVSLYFHMSSVPTLGGKIAPSGTSIYVPASLYDEYATRYSSYTFISMEG